MSDEKPNEQQTTEKDEKELSDGERAWLALCRATHRDPKTGIGLHRDPNDFGFGRGLFRPFP